MTGGYAFGYEATLHKRIATTFDVYGNAVIIWDDFEFTNAAFWRGTPDSTNDHYVVSTAEATLVLPQDANPYPDDEVTVDGQRWRVNGFASNLRSVFTGTEGGVLCQLEVIE